MEEHGENFPIILPIVKVYDIRLHSLATKKCQELDSKFEEKVRQGLAGIMGVYDKSIYDSQRYLQWPKINFRYEHPIYFSFFQEIKHKYEITKVDV